MIIKHVPIAVSATMTLMSFKSRLPFDVPNEQKEVLLAGYVWRGSLNLLPVTAAVGDDFTIIALAIIFS